MCETSKISSQVWKAHKTFLDAHKQSYKKICILASIWGINVVWHCILIHLYFVRVCKCTFSGERPILHASRERIRETALSTIFLEQEAGLVHVHLGLENKGVACRA
jgi:hypothetical protein